MECGVVVQHHLGKLTTHVFTSEYCCAMIVWYRTHIGKINRARLALARQFSKNGYP